MDREKQVATEVCVYMWLNLVVSRGTGSEELACTGLADCRPLSHMAVCRLVRQRDLLKPVTGSGNYLSLIATGLAPFGE